MATSTRRLGRSPVRRSVSMMLADVESLYLAHHRSLGRSEKTIYHYEDSFRLMDVYLSEVGQEPTTEALVTQTFQGLVAYLKRTPTRLHRGDTERSIHGIHGVMKDWRAFTRWAYEEGHIKALPKVPVPKLPEEMFPVLTEADLSRIFACKQLDTATEIGTRNRALIAFMLDTGVRLNEVAGLELADLDLRDGMAKVWGKGNKERMVFFSPGVSEALERWLNVRGDESGPLFWLTDHGIIMLLKRIKKESGLPRLHAHQLRHTAATMMVRQRADLHTVKRILGHAQLSTTEKYLSMATEDLKAKHSSSSPFEKIRESVEPTPIRGKRRLRSA